MADKNATDMDIINPEEIREKRLAYFDSKQSQSGKTGPSTSTTTVSSIKRDNLQNDELMNTKGPDKFQKQSRHYDDLDDFEAEFARQDYRINSPLKEVKLKSNKFVPNPPLDVKESNEFVENTNVQGFFPVPDKNFVEENLKMNSAHNVKQEKFVPKLSLRDSHTAESVSVFQSEADCDDLGLSTHRPSAPPSTISVLDKRLMGDNPLLDASEIKSLLGEDKYEEFLRKSVKDINALYQNKTTETSPHLMEDNSSTIGPSTIGPSTIGPSTIGPSTVGPYTVTETEVSTHVSHNNHMVYNNINNNHVTLPTNKSRQNTSSTSQSNSSKVSDRTMSKNINDLELDYRQGQSRNYDQVLVSRNVVFSADEIYRQAYGARMAVPGIDPRMIPQVPSSPPYNVVISPRQQQGYPGNVRMPYPSYQPMSPPAMCMYNSQGELFMSPQSPQNSYYPAFFPRQPAPQQYLPSGVQGMSPPNTSFLNYPPPGYPNMNVNNSNQYCMYLPRPPAEAPSQPMNNQEIYRGQNVSNPENFRGQNGKPHFYPHNHYDKFAKNTNIQKEAQKREKLSQPPPIKQLVVKTEQKKKETKDVQNTDDTSLRHKEAVRQYHEQRRSQQEDLDEPTKQTETQNSYTASSLHRYFSSLENLNAQNPIGYSQDIDNGDKSFDEKEIDNLTTITDSSVVTTAVDTEITCATNMTAGGLTDRLEKLGITVPNLKPDQSKVEESTNGCAKAEKKVKICPECTAPNKEYMTWCADCGEVLIGIEAVPAKKKKNKPERYKKLKKVKKDTPLNAQKDLPFSTQNHKQSTVSSVSQNSLPNGTTDIDKQRPRPVFSGNAASRGHISEQNKKTVWMSSKQNQISDHRQNNPPTEPLDVSDNELADTEISTTVSDSTVANQVKFNSKSYPKNSSKPVPKINSKLDPKLDPKFDPKFYRTDKDINEICDVITDPVIRGYIRSYFNKKTQSALEVEQSSSDAKCEDVTSTYTDKTLTEVEDTEVDLDSKQINGEDSSLSINLDLSNATSVLKQASTSNAVDRPKSGNSIRPKSENSEQKSKGRSFGKKKDNVEIDIEVFGIEEREKDIKALTSSIVPSLNLASSSSDEDDDTNTLKQQIMVDSSVESDVFHAILDSKKTSMNGISNSVEKKDSFLAQILGPKTPKKLATNKSSSQPKKAVQSKVAQSMNGAPYQRRWEKSNLAWSSIHPREINLKSTVSMPKARIGFPNKSSSTHSLNNFGSVEASPVSSGNKIQTARQRPASADLYNRKISNQRPGSAQPTRSSSAQIQSTRLLNRPHSAMTRPHSAITRPTHNAMPRPSSAQVRISNKKSLVPSPVPLSFDDLDRAGEDDDYGDDEEEELDVSPILNGEDENVAMPKFVHHRLPAEVSITQAVNLVPQTSLTAYNKYMELTPRFPEGDFSPWVCMPDEIWLHIFSYLEHIDLKNCGLVSTQFHRVALDEMLWKCIAVKKQHAICDEWLSQIARRHPISLALIQCHGDLVTSDGLKNMFTECSGSLRELNFTRCSRGSLTGDSILLHAAETCFNLTHLDASWCHVTDTGLSAIAQSSKRLESVCINGCQVISDVGLENLIQKHGSSLRVLEMFGCFNISQRGLRYLANNCNNLYTLNLGQCYKLTDSCMTQISANLGRIENLDLRGCKQIRDNCIRKIVRNCPRLKTLVLANCPNISDTAMVEVATYSMDIRNIDVCGNRNITDYSIRNITNNCQRLTSLDISSTGCTSRSVHMLANYGNRCLETAKFNFLTDVTENSLLKLVKHCSKLKVLHLYGCNNIRNLHQLLEINRKLEVEM